MKYSIVEVRENESPQVPASAVVAAPAPAQTAVVQPPQPPSAPLGVMLIAPRRDVSIVQSPLSPVHVLDKKGAPSDLAETANNAAVRALLKATVAAMELHELVDPPMSAPAPAPRSEPDTRYESVPPTRRSKGL